MACITLNIANFRTQFPAFGQAFQYSDAVLQAYFDQGTAFINSNTAATSMKPAQQTLALYLMTAHLLALSDMIKKGQSPSMVTASSVDKISVTLEPPPAKTQFQWWLNLTPYGAELSALLAMLSTGGFYFGNNAELSAFRKVGGFF